MNKKLKNGLFITFEGGEGSGKTSVIKSVAEKLLKEGYEVVCTREPGGIKISEQIRKIILSNDNSDMEPETEVLLFAASRTEHLIKKIIPSLKDNKIILCDRYLDSSIVYQGITRRLDPELVLKANCFACDYLPTRTFFLDVTPKVGLSRIKDRVDLNRLDQENITFHENVYNGYKLLSNKYSNRIEVIDGERQKYKIVEDVLKSIYKLLK